MKACYPQLYLNNDPRRHTLIINDLKGNTGGTQPGAPLRSKHLGTHNHQHFLNFHNCRKKTPPSWDESKGKLITDAYSYFKVNPRWGYGMGRSGAGRGWGGRGALSPLFSHLGGGCSPAPTTPTDRHQFSSLHYHSAPDYSSPLS